MCANKSSEDSSVRCLTRDLNCQTFFSGLRRQEQRHRETSTGKYDHQHPSKYSSFNQSRGFTRLLASPFRSAMIDENGRLLINALSRQLQDDYLSVVRRQWEKSRMTFDNKIQTIQAELHSQTDMSLKRTRCHCQTALVKWTLKNRFRWNYSPDYGVTPTGTSDLRRQFQSTISMLEVFVCPIPFFLKISEAIDRGSIGAIKSLQWQSDLWLSTENDDDNDDADHLSLRTETKIFLDEEVNMKAEWQRSAEDQDWLSSSLLSVKLTLFNVRVHKQVGQQDTLSTP